MTKSLISSQRHVRTVDRHGLGFDRAYLHYRWPGTSGCCIAGTAAIRTGRRQRSAPELAVRGSCGRLRAAGPTNPDGRTPNGGLHGRE